MLNLQPAPGPADISPDIRGVFFFEFAGCSRRLAWADCRIASHAERIPASKPGQSRPSVILVDFAGRCYAAALSTRTGRAVASIRN